MSKISNIQIKQRMKYSFWNLVTSTSAPNTGEIYNNRLSQECNKKLQLYLNEAVEKNDARELVKATLEWFHILYTKKVETRQTSCEKIKGYFFTPSSDQKEQELKEFAKAEEEQEKEDKDDNRANDEILITQENIFTSNRINKKILASNKLFEEAKSNIENRQIAVLLNSKLTLYDRGRRGWINLSQESGKTFEYTV